MLKIQPQHQAKTVGWPSGLRRYVQVVVFSKARVRIPLQSKLLFFISRNEFVFLHIINSLQVDVSNERKSMEVSFCITSKRNGLVFGEQKQAGTPQQPHLPHLRRSVE